MGGPLLEAEAAALGRKSGGPETVDGRGRGMDAASGARNTVGRVGGAQVLTKTQCEPNHSGRVPSSLASAEEPEAVWVPVV